MIATVLFAESFSEAARLCYYHKLVITIKVADSMATHANDESERLHPAAAVFRSVILGEISSENKRLDKDVARLQPLLNHMQKVEVTATVGGGGLPIPVPGGDGTQFEAPPVVNEIISTVKLSEGAIVGNMFSLPITSSQELLLNYVRWYWGNHGR